MKRAAIAVIRLYQATVSPDHGWLRSYLSPTCRFEPTCSDYAIGAINRYGVIYGSWLAMGRISRCHPFHPGGRDPVPDKSKK